MVAKKVGKKKVAKKAVKKVVKKPVKKPAPKKAAPKKTLKKVENDEKDNDRRLIGFQGTVELQSHLKSIALTEGVTVSKLLRNAVEAYVKKFSPTGTRKTAAKKSPRARAS